MNFKKVLWIAVIASASMNAYAFEIYKGKVLSDKAWSNDGSKVSIERKSLSSRHGRIENQQRWIQARLPNNKTIVGALTKIEHSHEVTLWNNSSETRTYMVSKGVCTAMEAEKQHCAMQYKQVSLEPDGYYQDSDVPVLKHTFDKPGLYKVFAYTGANEDFETHDFSTGSMARGSITVS